MRITKRQLKQIIRENVGVEPEPAWDLYIFDKTKRKGKVHIPTRLQTFQRFMPNSVARFEITAECGTRFEGKSAPGTSVVADLDSDYGQYTVSSDFPVGRQVCSRCDRRHKENVMLSKMTPEEYDAYIEKHY